MGLKMNSYKFIFLNKFFIYIYRQANPSLYVIDVGMQNRLVADSWTLKNLKVSKIIVHSGFNWDSIQQDIALVKLEVSFIYFVYILLKNI